MCSARVCIFRFFLITFVVLITLVMFGVGCSYYNVSGSLSSHIKTAAVPLFENETTEAGLVEEVTVAVRDAIFSDGTMKPASEFQADALVNGTIIDFVDEADAFTKDEKASRFKVHVFVKVQFFDRVKNKVIWEEKRMEGWGEYDPSGTSEEEDMTREDAIEKALDMLAKEIIDKTITGW